MINIKNEKNHTNIGILKCLFCGKDVSLTTNMCYKHNNDGFEPEYFPVHKNCIQKYMGNSKDVGYIDKVIDVLRMLNRPYIHSSWIKNECNFGKYLKELSLSQNKTLTFHDSEFKKEILATENVNNDYGYSEKWRGTYPNEDIEFLNNYLSGLMKDFKIINTSHMDYARKICKASLHMDKCFDEMSSGVAGADKKYESAKKIFDDLSKSANFAESSRNKDLSSGSLSKIVDTVENGTYVYEHVPFDKDLYDRLLENQKHVDKSV
ncbi:hypothetical protein G7L40_00545 [Paenibacillus polymyxa]|uniref:hypothetical protein n=1 Tax=Paenibacillus polymyxa TaxID=1406 RepID=UPI0011C0374A|nr:hypothetical protein [Paenibacillus polymyxa]MCC3257551.1 hypothetical protein [Paenibacillus polymyxa]QPK56452.1 hypothetical protein G7L40_00545 [Paenibacillus polymyxa]